MGKANVSTVVNPKEPGLPMFVPEHRLAEITVILRVIIAMSEDDTDTLICEGEPYEILARRLKSYRYNLGEVAKQIREVTGYEH